MQNLTPVEFFDLVYCPERLPATNQATTRAAYRLDLLALERYHGGRLTIATLTAEAIKQKMADLVARGRSTATANRLFRHTLAVWRLAADRGLAPPPPRQTRYRETLDEPTAWLPHELAALLRAAAEAPGRVGEVPAAVWYPALLLVMLSTGARISAVMSATTAALDLTRGEITLAAATQKHRRGQRLDLYPSAVAYLRRLAVVDRLPTVFGDWPHDRTRPGWVALNRRLRRLIVAAELRPHVAAVTRRDLWHKLRKTTASQLAAVAGPIVAQTRLGHSSPTVTARYLDGRLIGAPLVRDLLPDPFPMLPGDAAQLRLFDAG